MLILTVPAPVTHEVVETEEDDDTAFNSSSEFVVSDVNALVVCFPTLPTLLHFLHSYASYTRNSCPCVQSVKLIKPIVKYIT